MKIRISILFSFLYLSIFSSFAQKGGLPLADEYFRDKQYSKAADIYHNFTQNPIENNKISEKYFKCLIENKQIDQAEKYLKLCIKQQPQNIDYKFKLANFYQSIQKTDQSKKIIDKIVSDSKKDPSLASIYSTKLLEYQYIDAAKTVLINAREKSDDRLAYSYELANIYKKTQKPDLMVDELINWMSGRADQKEEIKNKFQNFIETPQEQDLFEQILITKTQQYPDDEDFYDLLIWLYLQKKDFARAFIFAKSYDKKLKNSGDKSMEVGVLAFENKSFDQASQVFDFIVANYKDSHHYPTARKLRIEAKEAFVKTIYPIDKVKIQGLVNDYHLLIKELGKNNNTMDAYKNMAILYGFWLDKKDSAIETINQIVDYQYADIQLKNRCKLTLGDLYLLKDEPWESTLIYGQVEKEMKDQLLGHEAKLKNAKLAFYKGEFLWAQEQLDVLKMATSREIANDAMELSLLIQDNTISDDDSLHLALGQYAEADLLIFQNKYDLALNKLDSMIQKYPNHSLIDEVYYLQAKIYQKTRNFDKSIEKLKIIDKNHKSDIYGDDAAFLLASIEDEDLNHKDIAKELYQKFLIDFPSSIYTSEARKRYRKLRGDHEYQNP